MKDIRGNLITLAKSGEFDTIIHGCNCFCNFGAGFAAQIKRSFPEAYEADCSTKIGDKNKLGSFTWACSNDIIIINGYTQFYPGKRNSKSELYGSIEQVFKKVSYFFPNRRIGIPTIGSGLAGGNFLTIYNIIESQTTNLDITMVFYEPYPK